uniref:Uncharacterized protein n=1 Tax=Rhizophora mucronata TaxID=61149 RepID=A0A2P2PA26_RHIMU
MILQSTYSQKGKGKGKRLHNYINSLLK